tara:strand:+ start:1742 stop:2353 length:612 start_codon:yes stop_codon:yes gene_type:complete
MIHGKKRNGDLFRRLTESWGYTKSETNEEEATPLDEEMAADTETVTEEEEVVEEEEEVQTEGGMYKREDDEDDKDSGELEENMYQAYDQFGNLIDYDAIQAQHDDDQAEMKRKKKKAEKKKSDAAITNSARFQGENKDLEETVSSRDKGPGERRKEDRKRPMEEAEASADEEIVEEDTDTTDNLEEAIRKVVKQAIKTIKANK